MEITRWEPWRELDDLRSRLNTLFGGPRQPGEHSSRENMTVADWVPVVDITENEAEYLITAELPDVNREDVQVTIQDGVLSIRGERRREREETTPKYHRIERSYGSFLRRFIVPEGVDEQNLKAEFNNGLLRLHLPKSPKAQPRAVEIEVK